MIFAHLSSSPPIFLCNLPELHSPRTEAVSLDDLDTFLNSLGMSAALSYLSGLSDWNWLLADENETTRGYFKIISGEMAPTSGEKGVRRGDALNALLKSVKSLSL